MLGFTTLEPPDERAANKHDTIDSSTVKRGRDQDTPGFKRGGYETQQTESTLQRSSAFKRKHSGNSGGESATPGQPVGALTLQSKPLQKQAPFTLPIQADTPTLPNVPL